MKTINIGKAVNASAIALGCMRMHPLTIQQADSVLMSAYENGINFFDHSDIYAANGVWSDDVFGRTLALHPGLRDKIVIQSKCGIKQGYYDHSKEHIITSVNGSLKHLQIETLDILLLHRPDTLLEPEEVGEAFDELHKAGKVRCFGVSNYNPMQIELLKSGLNVPIIANQLQFGLKASGMIDCGFNVNMSNAPSIMHDGSLLEYCRLNNITIQAWSPFLYGFFEGNFIDNPKFEELNSALETLARKYGVEKNAVAAAWILRHPANMQVIIGTMNPQRIAQISEAADINLTREEWYYLYKAAGNLMP